jgi:membrane protease YdiL (CAAX protease family)
LEGAVSRLLGIAGNWQNEAIMGFVYAGAFIMINKMYPAIALGYPKEFILGSAFLTAVFLAPILEEVAFRGILLAINPGGFGGWGKYALNALIFSGFHVLAYGMALQTAFVGAFVFGLVACFVADRQGSLTTAITMHMGFNWWLTEGAKLVFIGG